MKHSLSIIIPTYNRKERLKKQLQSIHNQADHNEVDIVLCDNCSNYNVKEMVLRELPSSFANSMRV